MEWMTFSCSSRGMSGFLNSLRETVRPESQATKGVWTDFSHIGDEGRAFSAQRPQRVCAGRKQKRGVHGATRESRANERSTGRDQSSLPGAERLREYGFGLRRPK